MANAASNCEGCGAEGPSMQCPKCKELSLTHVTIAVDGKSRSRLRNGSRDRGPDTDCATRDQHRFSTQAAHLLAPVTAR